MRAHAHTHTASDCDIFVMVEWIQQKMEEIAGEKDRICEITRLTTELIHVTTQY